MLARALGPPLIAPHRRLPAHAQYAYASHQSTKTTGNVPLFVTGHDCVGTNDVRNAQAGGARPDTGFDARNAAYWSFVTSVLSMQNVPTRTGVGPAVPGQGPVV